MTTLPKIPSIKSLNPLKGINFEYRPIEDATDALLFKPFDLLKEVASSVMTADESKGELSVVILGSSQKGILFDKLCGAADSYERHVHYNDVHYLTINTNGVDQVVEVTDPGMAHTGGREMAIRRADFAIVYYSSLSPSSFHQLTTLVTDFQLKKNLPIRLICDTDEMVEYEEDGSSTGISSVSEGYESESDGDRHLQRKNSMEKIRKAHEEGRVTEEQAQQLAETFGTNCSLVKISSANFSEARVFLEEVVVETLSHRKGHRSGSLLKKKIIRIGSKKAEDKKLKKINSQDSEHGEKSSSKSKNSKNQDSKVCSIM